MFRANFFPSSGAQDWDFFKAFGIVSSCCGRQGFGARQRGTTCTVWRKLLAPLPTTTTGHYTTCCKKPQSCAPEDGQKFARNMLSWSLEINKTVIVASRWFLFYLTYCNICSAVCRNKLKTFLCLKNLISVPCCRPTCLVYEVRNSDDNYKFHSLFRKIWGN